MTHQEFVSHVENQSGTDDAETTIRAVLETLADHLAGNAPAKLAAQLPQEIGAFITDYKSDETAEGEGFGVAEFIRRAANKSGENDEATARKNAVAVLGALRAAVSDGEFEKMRGTLPPEYDELFGAGTFENSNVRRHAN